MWISDIGKWIVYPIQMTLTEFIKHPVGYPLIQHTHFMSESLALYPVKNGATFEAISLLQLQQPVINSASIVRVEFRCHYLQYGFLD